MPAGECAEKNLSPGLTDPFHRRIEYLRISVTDRCNLRCVYCMPEKGVNFFREPDILTAWEISRVAQVAHTFGLRKVRITGGEPLVRKDIIPLISSLKNRVGIHDLSLTTNGVMLAEKAKSLKAAGLDRVNISLDTMDSRRYRAMTRGGDIFRVWEAIDEAEEAGLLPIKLNIVPLRGMNDDEILRFASLTFDKDYHIRFIEFMPMGENAWKPETCIRKDEIMERVSTLGRLIPLEFNGQGPSRNYRLEGARGVIGFISPISDHFCGFCNRLRLTATGRIRPCLFSRVEVDVRTPLRNGANDRDLAALFEHAVSSKSGGHSLYENAHSEPGLASMSQIGG